MVNSSIKEGNMSRFYRLKLVFDYMRVFSVNVSG